MAKCPPMLSAAEALAPGHRGYFTTEGMINSMLHLMFAQAAWSDMPASTYLFLTQHFGNNGNVVPPEKLTLSRPTLQMWKESFPIRFMWQTKSTLSLKGKYIFCWVWCDRARVLQVREHFSVRLTDRCRSGCTSKMSRGKKEPFCKKIFYQRFF